MKKKKNNRIKILYKDKKDIKLINLIFKKKPNIGGTPLRDNNTINTKKFL